MAQDGRPAQTTALPTAPPHERQVETSAPPELCGFLDRTSSVTCDPGYTCKFNTDYYAVGCCSNDACDWGTTCCDYGLAGVTLTGSGVVIQPCDGGSLPRLNRYWFVLQPITMKTKKPLTRN